MEKYSLTAAAFSASNPKLLQSPNASYTLYCLQGNKKSPADAINLNYTVDI